MLTTHKTGRLLLYIYSNKEVIHFAGKAGIAGSRGAEPLRNEVYLCYCLLGKNKHTIKLQPIYTLGCLSVEDLTPG